jgi:hypothetical protein
LNPKVVKELKADDTFKANMKEMIDLMLPLIEKTVE